MINIVEFCDVVYIEKWNQVNDVVRIVFWINLLNHSNSMKVSWGKNVVMLIYNSKILLFWIKKHSTVKFVIDAEIVPLNNENMKFLNVHSDVNLRNFFEFKTKKRRILRVSEQWYKMYDWERIPY